MPDEPKSHAILLQELLNGGFVNNQAIAIGVAELVLANAFGAEEVERQGPFTAVDQADRWLVQGSDNPDRQREGLGPAKVWIRKRDATILDLQSPMIVEAPAEVQRIIQKKLKQDRSSQD